MLGENVMEGAWFWKVPILSPPSHMWVENAKKISQSVEVIRKIPTRWENRRECTINNVVQ